MAHKAPKQWEEIVFIRECDKYISFGSVLSLQKEKTLCFPTKDKIIKQELT